MTALRGTVVDAAEVTGALQERWREIRHGQPRLASPFFAAGFTAAARRAQPLVRVLVLQAQGRTVGFFPFQFASRWHARGGWAQRVGGDLSDYFGLIAEDEVRVTPRELLRLAGLSHLLFTHLDETQLRHGLLAEAPETGLLIRMPDGGAVYWEQLAAADRKLATNTRRREKALESEHGRLRFQLDDRGAEALAHLIASKRAQYARTEVGDPLARPEAEALLHALWGADDPEVQGLVSTLHAGDTWVASHFGLRSGTHLHYWFPVYNPELRPFSPGRLLLRQIILCGEIREIDRGAGDSPAKRDFANTEHRFLRGVWRRPVPQGLAYDVVQRLGWRFSALARALRGQGARTAPAAPEGPPDAEAAA